jgi:hypothetical protein
MAIRWCSATSGSSTTARRSSLSVGGWSTLSPSWERVSGMPMAFGTWAIAIVARSIRFEVALVRSRRRMSPWSVRVGLIPERPLQGRRGLCATVTQGSLAALGRPGLFERALRGRKRSTLPRPRQTHPPHPALSREGRGVSCDACANAQLQRGQRGAQTIDADLQGGDVCGRNSQSRYRQTASLADASGYYFKPPQFGTPALSHDGEREF